MEEVWKDIEDFEGLYQVSNLGKIKSRYRILKQSGKRYLKVCLSKNNKKYYFDVHKLVCIAFLSNKLNANEINHINGDKTDNRVENLEWCNHSYNQKHAYKIGLHIPHKTQKKSVLKLKNNFLIEKYESIKVASIKNNIKYYTLRYVINNKKEYNGYFWLLEND